MVQLYGTATVQLYSCTKVVQLYRIRFLQIVQAYFRKIPTAVATSFVSRLLRLGPSQLVQKCVSRRGGHGRGVDAPAPPRVRKIEFRSSKKSSWRVRRKSIDPGNRSTAVELL